MNEIVDLDLYNRIGDELDGFKNAPSGRTHINHYFSNLISINRATTMARHMLMMGKHDEIICGH